MNEEFSIFDVSASSVLVEESTESIFYNPSADKGIDKVYTSQIKFIPNIFNPSMPMVKKYTYWLVNSETEDRKSVDCPSTVGQYSLLQDTFFTLYKSTSARDKALADGFKRRQAFYALVYIVKDEHQPNMEGKIKVFKFGNQLYDILKQSANDPDEPNDFLNIFTGKTLKLQVTEKSGFNCYTQSKFMNKVDNLNIDGKSITDSPANRKLLVSWLKEHSPNLSEYEYKPWDEETRNFVIDVIKANIPSGVILDKLLKKGGGHSTSTTSTTSKPKNTIPEKKVSKAPVIEDDDVEEKEIEVDLDDDEEDDEMSELNSFIKSKKTPKPVSKKKQVIEEDDDDEDFFED